MAEPTGVSGDLVRDADTRALPPVRRTAAPLGRWWLALIVLAAGAVGWWVWQGRARLQAPQAQGAAVSESAVAPSAPPLAAALPAPLASAVLPAAAPAEPQADATPLMPADVPGALAALVGPEALRELLIGDDFVRRLVVTVDNLGREHAPARLWPLRPTPGHFLVVEQDGQLTAGLDNAARYTPLVLLIERVDLDAAVALYRRLLPMLQAAYEQLGYPGQRFHARLLVVIDHLLAAPQPPQPIALRLVEVKGEVPSREPWLRYEFAAPALEAASAGHKLMMRVGVVNERRLKARLRELRDELQRQAGR